MEKSLLFSPLPFWMISDYALNYIKGPLILVYFTKFKQIFISYVRMIYGNQIWLPFVLGATHRNYPEGDEMLAQVAQTNCRRPVPGSVQGKAGWGPE